MQYGVVCKISIVQIPISSNRTESEIVRKEKLSQDIYDNFFLNIEYHLRELGYGDIAVNKKMKILNKIFYDILLKINLKENKNDLINDKVIKLYLYNDSSLNKEIITKSCNYFAKFIHS